MKKLAYLVSAISAAAFSTAHADISVSGAANVNYHSAGSNTQVVNGGSVSFALSTTTDSGMTISSGAGITADVDGYGAAAFSGMTSITFTTGGTSITIGEDVGATDGTGEVGDIVTYADYIAQGPSTSVGIGDHEGSGVSLTTGFGDASLTAVYVFDAAAGGDLDGATGTATSVKLSMPVGVMTVAGSYASSDAAGTVNNESAISVSYAAAGGTLTAGYASSDGDTASSNGTAGSVKYAMNLDGTSITVGYVSYDTDATSSITDIVVSRSLGGGASVFAEMRSVAGTVTTTAGSDNNSMAIGTSVSF
jgi:hypothetical protein